MAVPSYFEEGTLFYVYRCVICRDAFFSPRQDLIMCAVCTKTFQGMLPIQRATTLELVAW